MIEKLPSNYYRETHEFKGVKKGFFEGLAYNWLLATQFRRLGGLIKSKLIINELLPDWTPLLCLYSVLHEVSVQYY